MIAILAVVIAASKLVLHLQPYISILLANYESPTSPFTYMKENLTQQDMVYYTSAVIAAGASWLTFINSRLYETSPCIIRPLAVAAIFTAIILGFLLNDWANTVCNVYVLVGLTLVFGLVSFFLVMGAGCIGVISLLI